MLRFLGLLIVLIVPKIFGLHEIRFKKLVPPVDPNADEKLVFTQPIWRHGDRSPIYEFPLDENKPEIWNKGGGGHGQLSPVGMQQHVELGQKLRNHYADFVSHRYQSHEVYIRSTDLNRTIVSALSNMIGFFDGSTSIVDVDYPNLKSWPAHFIPVPIHAADRDTDFVLGCHFESEYVKDVYMKLYRSPDFVKVAKDNADLINDLKKYTGVSKLELWDAYYVYDTLFIEKVNNLSWPTGIDETLYEKTNKLADLLDNLESGRNVSDSEGINFAKELPKITGGPLLSGMIDQMKAKRDCLENPNNRTKENHKKCKFFDPLKYYAFSAHDSTIGALFSTFGFKETNWNATGLPHYASCAALELYQTTEANNKTEYTVKLLYWSETYGPWDITSSIVGCEKGCTLEQFIARSKDYIIDDFQAYCSNSSDGLRIMTTLIFMLAFLIQFLP